MTGISDGRGQDDLASFPLHRAADNQDEAEQPDWSPLLPSGLETAQQTMRVDSNCSTTFDTWLDENTILYNVCLVATRDTGFSGAGRAHVAAADLAAHSSYFNTLFHNRHTFPADTADLTKLKVGMASSQQDLREMMGALYRQQLLLQAHNVESILRTAHCLVMPVLIEAAEQYIIQYVVQKAPVEVYLLGKDLDLDPLVHRAEAVVVQEKPGAPQAWAGDNLQRLKALLEGRNVQGVRSFLGRPDRSAVSELEVVEVLRQMPQRDLLAEAINFNAMGALEVAALGRVLRTLEREERRRQFWVDISDNVIERMGTMDGPARSPGLMLWSVPQSLLAGHAGQHNRLNSPGFIAVDKRRYTACFIFPEGVAGLFCYPENNRSLAEKDSRAIMTVFVLSQTAKQPLVLNKEVWTPSEHMEPGAGFGRPNCAAILIGDTPLSDVSYIEREARHTPEGKQSQVAYVVVGMHVWHQKPDEASPIPSQDQHGAYHQV